MSTGIHPLHFRDCIIRPSLKPLNLWSPSAEVLLLGTAAQESHCGHYLMQNGKSEVPRGPAISPYQFEPIAVDDVKSNSSVYRRLKENGLYTAPDEFSDLIYDLKSATIMCRLIYTRSPEALPKHSNLLAMGRYWKRHYNTYAGKGWYGEREGQDWVQAYETYILRYL